MTAKEAIACVTLHVLQLHLVMSRMNKTSGGRLDCAKHTIAQILALFAFVLKLLYKITLNSEVPYLLFSQELVQKLSTGNVPLKKQMKLQAILLDIHVS